MNCLNLFSHLKIRHTITYALFFALLSTFSGCEKKEDAASQKATTVTTIVVQAKDIPVSFEYVAQTQSSHLVNIQARVSGFLDKRVYTEGEIVEEGQELFLMDKKPFQAQLDAAQAALESQKAAHENASLNLARVKPLAQLDALSQKDLDDANSNFQTTKAAVEGAQAQLVTALLNLSYCTITSPIKGITSAALQQDGTYLNVADSQLTTVAALSPIWVNFSLSENQIQEYRDDVEKGTLILPKDSEFVVKVIQVNGRVFPHTGKITFAEPFFNPDTGTFLIRASVDNPDAILRPNQFVRAVIEGAIRPNAILVPQRAVQQSSKGPFVWVINKENKAEFRPVIAGDWQGSNWFVSDGLISGEQVVVDGGITLYPGAEVKIKQVIQDDTKTPDRVTNSRTDTPS